MTQNNAILQMAPALTAMGILLINSCHIFFSLMEKCDRPEFRPSVRIHGFTTFLLILAVSFLLWSLFESSDGLLKWAFGLATLSVVGMIPCAFILAARCGLLGLRLQRLSGQSVNGRVRE